MVVLAKVVVEIPKRERPRLRYRVVERLAFGDAYPAFPALYQFVGARVALVLDDPDAARRERPQQLLGEQLPAGRLDERVSASIHRDPFVAVEFTDEPDPIVETEIGRLPLVPRPLRTVPHDRRGPSVPVAELGEREQQALEVRFGVESAGVDDVGSVGRDGRLDDREIDADRNDRRSVAARTERADTRPEELRVGDDAVGCTDGDALESAVGLVAEPVTDERRAGECGAEPGRENGDRRRRRDDHRIGAIAGEQCRHPREKRRPRRRDGDCLVGEAVAALSPLRVVPPAGRVDSYLVTAGGEFRRNRVEAAGTGPIRERRRILEDDPKAHRGRRPRESKKGRETSRGNGFESRGRGSTVYDIERYLNIRSAYGASFSPDGTLSFLMDTTGTPQVWTLSEPGEWPEQRTFFDERVTFVSASPTREEFVFGMDRGGNEREQLFRLAADGRITDLTDTDAKHRWGGWSHDGERFAFASNRRDESVFDVYVQGREDDDAELLQEGDGWLSLGGWSPSDDRLLVHEARSSFDHDVHVLSAEDGEMSRLTPDTREPTRYQSLSWGPDGESLYLVTDRDADTLYLARAAVDGGELETVRTGGEWNVDGIALDEETGRLVYSRNVDGYTELTVGRLDGPTSIEEYPTPALPDGVAGGVSFDDDAERFAISVTADAENTNVYVVDVGTGSAERWTSAPTAGIPASSFVATELVRYESFDGRSIPAFFSLPREVPDGGAPVIVDIHGGPESQRRPSFSPVKQYWLANGYAVLEPNVRGSTGYGRAYTRLDDVEKRMDSVADIEAAVEWLLEQPAIDPDGIVAMGGSYGGFMVLAALTEYPDLWAAGVDIVGIANFVTFLENTGSWRRELREAEYGSLEADREFLESISPVNNIGSIEAPLFVLHGENDPRVPVGEARQIAEEAAEHVPVRTLIFEDEGHGFSKLENRIEAYSAIVEFLNNHVRM